MSASLIKFAEALKAVDPGKIAKMYPSKSQYDEYLATKREAEDLLQHIRPNGLSEEFLDRLKTLCDRLNALADQVADGTELAGRVLTNKIVVWAEAHHLERAIFIAGQCEGMNIREPYRTQIRLQPANACMTRYRQVFNIAEWIKDNLQAQPSGKVADIIMEMLNSLLDQFIYFATQAEAKNEGHVHAKFMLALAYLFRAHGASAHRAQDDADDYAKVANAIVSKINEPTNDSPRIELRYHKMNYCEFSSFKRLHTQHKEIADRLKFLHDRADRLIQDNGGTEERCYFWFSSYVGGMARAASVVGLVGAAAGAFGVDLQASLQAVDAAWHMAVESVPGFDVAQHSVQHLQLAHTGGLTVNATHLAELKTMLHTGGLV